MNFILNVCTNGPSQNSFVRSRKREKINQLVSQLTSQCEFHHRSALLVVWSMPAKHTFESHSFAMKKRLHLSDNSRNWILSIRFEIGRCSFAYYANFNKIDCVSFSIGGGSKWSTHSTISWPFENIVNKGYLISMWWRRFSVRLLCRLRRCAHAKFVKNVDVACPGDSTRGNKKWKQIKETKKTRILWRNPIIVRWLIQKMANKH